MCDPFSMMDIAFGFMDASLGAKSAKISGISAEANSVSAMAGAVDARGRTALETAQIEAAILVGTAQARDEETELRKTFGEQMQQNIGAMAISGLAFGSFDAILDGNEREVMDEVGQIVRNDQRNKQNLTLAARERQRSGRMEELGFRGQSLEALMTMMDARGRAAGAMFAGAAYGLKTIGKAEKDYQKNHSETGGGEWGNRVSYFKKSAGFK